MLLTRRGGRVVECGGLENRCPFGDREFESPPLRHFFQRLEKTAGRNPGRVRRGTCERSSVVEPHLAKVTVVSSNLIARSNSGPVCTANRAFFA